MSLPSGNVPAATPAPRNGVHFASAILLLSK